MKKLCFVLFSILSISFVNADQLEVERISEKIIVLKEDYFRSVAILTEKGVVLIDTRFPLEKMEEIKQLVKQEFKTDHFCYIINTHGCPEHITGNPAFPDVPAIMNENFFNRKKLYKKQKGYIDSLEVACAEANDTALRNADCKEFENRKNWGDWCIRALEIEPDITYSEKMNLYFDSLSIHIFLTGLGHGYSTFIYIPEEKFLHVSTLGSNNPVIKFRVPEYLDESEFIPYQIKVLKEVIGYTDTLKYIMPGHGDFYSSAILKQMLGYYADMFEFAKNCYLSKIDFETFKSECVISKRYSGYEIFKDLNEENIQQHNENVEWLWSYFKRNSN